MTKLLFIDRDGTLIVEPQPDQQVDSLEKLEFVPGVIFALARIARELDYELVLVTNQDGLGHTSVEGGVIFPFAVELPWAFRMGLMTEFDFVRDPDRRRHHTEFVNSITFARDIVHALGGYVEFFSETSSRGGPWVGTVDVGLTYGITEDIQIDAGVNVGVTRAAEDVNPFVGLSVRF